MNDFDLHSVLGDLLDEDIFRTTSKKDDYSDPGYTVNKNNERDIYVFPVVGLNKKDVSAAINENHILTVTGKGKDAYTGVDYSVNYMVRLTNSSYDLQSVHSVLENGLLYIIIPKTLKGNKTIKIM